MNKEILQNLEARRSHIESVIEEREQLPGKIFTAEGSYNIKGELIPEGRDITSDLAIIEKREETAKLVSTHTESVLRPRLRQVEEIFTDQLTEYTQEFNDTLQLRRVQLRQIKQFAEEGDLSADIAKRREKELAELERQRTEDPFLARGLDLPQKVTQEKPLTERKEAPKATEVLSKFDVRLPNGTMYKGRDNFPTRLIGILAAMKKEGKTYNIRELTLALGDEDTNLGRNRTRAILTSARKVLSDHNYRVSMTTSRLEMRHGVLGRYELEEIVPKNESLQEKNTVPTLSPEPVLQMKLSDSVTLIEPESPKASKPEKKQRAAVAKKDEVTFPDGETVTIAGERRANLFQALAAAAGADTPIKTSKLCEAVYGEDTPANRTQLFKLIAHNRPFAELLGYDIHQAISQKERLTRGSEGAYILKSLTTLEVSITENKETTVFKEQTPSSREPRPVRGIVEVAPIIPEEDKRKLEETVILSAVVHALRQNTIVYQKKITSEINDMLQKMEGDSHRARSFPSSSSLGEPFEAAYRKMAKEAKAPYLLRSWSRNDLLLWESIHGSAGVEEIMQRLGPDHPLKTLWEETPPSERLSEGKKSLMNIVRAENPEKFLGNIRHILRRSYSEVDNGK